MSRQARLPADLAAGAADSVQTAQGLASQFGNEFKVLVTMQNREPQSFGNGSEQEVGNAGRAVLALRSKQALHFEGTLGNGGWHVPLNDHSRCRCAARLDPRHGRAPAGWRASPAAFTLVSVRRDWGG
jgi:hypothetical protein